MTGKSTKANEQNTDKTQENTMRGHLVDEQSDVRLPPEVQGELGRQLRQVYGKLLAEPLPDKFTQLLAQLAKPESKS
ncbi:MAG: NepR family anti-sigma factor [Hyphomicrobium sp.]